MIVASLVPAARGRRRADPGAQHRRHRRRRPQASVSQPRMLASTPGVDQRGRGLRRDRASSGRASRRIDAGTSGVIGPVRTAATAAALRWSGTIARISRAARICRTDIESAWRRHVLEGRKPAFADLLAAAGLVERDDEVGLGGLEVGRRIVERQVRVLADADEGDVDRRALRAPRRRCGGPRRARRSPSSAWNVRMPARSTKCSRSTRRKLAG